jgi:DNA-binding transcriptional ArsR family regulator
MKEFMSLAKALGDDNRVRVLMFLRGGELCVCQIIEMLGLAPSTVSKHMAVLDQAGLVESEKRGRWNYYSRSPDPSPRVQLAFQWLDGSLTGDRKILDDLKQVTQVRKASLQELCEHYKNDATPARGEHDKSPGAA